MIDNIFLVIIMIGGGIWLALGITEHVYNRCKKRATVALLKRSVNSLARLARHHEGWDKGMGACQCADHREARLVIRAFHEHGGKLQ